MDAASAAGGHTPCITYVDSERRGLWGSLPVVRTPCIIRADQQASCREAVDANTLHCTIYTITCADP